jgi:hypothetical protein
MSGLDAGRQLIQLLRTISPTILDVNGFAGTFRSVAALACRTLVQEQKSTKKFGSNY